MNFVVNPLKLFAAAAWGLECLSCHKAGHDNQAYQKKDQSTADTDSYPKLLLQEVGPM